MSAFMVVMLRALPWVSGFGLIVFLASAVWLSHLEQTGPARADLVLDGGIPATLYLPRDAGPGAFVATPARRARPPGVALMHGFASDRLAMSTLARRLAESGYAVLAFDARGHGQNRNPFPPGLARQDAFFADFRTAVDFLRDTPLVDGARIAVAGHSMGAGAALDFATRDSGIGAAVMISGGRALQGPLRPPDTLFLYAAADPPRVATRAGELAAKLAGVRAVVPGRTYGDPSEGTGVRLQEIPGADHVTIVWTGRAARQIRDWLDAAFGIERAAGPVPADPRLFAAGVAGLSLLLVLPGLGLVTGRLVTRGEEPPAGRAAASLSLLAAALVATLPLLASGTPAPVLPLEVGDLVTSHLAFAGIALLVVFALRGRLSLSGWLVDPLRSVAGAVLAVVGVYVLLMPVGAVVHRTTLTPERTFAFALAALMLLPFSVAFQLLLRRGSTGRAAGLCVAGRLLVLGALALGVATGVLPRVVMLMLPSLVVVFALFELLATSIYAVSRNLAVIALGDAAWLALILAAILPIRI